MDLCKKCLIVIAGVYSVIADFHHEHYRSLSSIEANNPKPWFLDDFPHYAAEPSESITHYAYVYPYDSIGHGSSFIPTYSDYSPPYTSDSYYSSTKKIPNEDKTFKKPLYTITDKDSAKFKDFVLKSGSSYCQEIKSEKSPEDEKSTGTSKPSTMICYNCKDPKTGSTYERCSYSSQPKSPEKAEPFESRFRRSNKEFDSYKVGSVPPARVTTEQENEKLKKPYKFSKEYFLPEASRKFSIEHKTGDQCQKVYKNSMVCLVCKNPQTGDNSEQCSHGKDPNEKSYAYSKSQSFGKPRESEKTSSRKNKTPAPIHENTETKDYGKIERSDDKSIQDITDAAGSSECRKVRKDSEICTVCKDPKTGGNSQRCTYSYEPDEKIYKFSRSKSFGYPEGSKTEPNESDKKAPSNKKAYSDRRTLSDKKRVSNKEALSDKEGSESDPEESTTYSDDSSDDDSYSGYENPDADSGYESLEASSYEEDEESKESKPYDYGPSHAEYIKSESAKILKNAESDNCRKVQKDTMTCSICKDPKTGEESESCTYSYEPDEKKFSYTKSKSFGSPTKDRDGPEEFNDEGYPYSSSEYSDEGGYAYASNIKPTVSYPKGKLQLTAGSDAQGMVFLGGTDQSPVTKVDLELMGTSKRQAEMEKMLKDVPVKNGTKCKKVMKNEMTCYQCVDDTGFRQEECMYMKNPQKSSKVLNKSTVESKEVKSRAQPEAAATGDILKVEQKKRRRPIKTEETTTIPLEPTASANRRSYRIKRQPKSKRDDEKSYEASDSNEHGYNSEEKFTGERNQKKDQHPYETDPYEYVAETQYKYDKQIGLKLPAHMLEVSDYEKEFDETFYGNDEN